MWKREMHNAGANTKKNVKDHLLEMVWKREMQVGAREKVEAGCESVIAAGTGTVYFRLASSFQI